MRRLAEACGFLTIGLAVSGIAYSADVATGPLPEPSPPQLPQDVHGKDAIKTYLLTVVSSVRSASADIKAHGTQYAELCAKYGSPEQAAKAEPDQMASLIHHMRNDYKRIDSYGYEYVEGIVAGVPELMKYDVELDSGVPVIGASAQDQIADTHIKIPGLTLDRAGSLNNYLIEPTVYGTNPKFTSGQAELPGFEKKEVNLPNPALVVALADYAIDGYARLDKDASAWTPSDRDLFQAMANMTPTLADYFDEWKESKKYGQAEGGRFVAVSRVSDMRGIMASTRLNWQSLRGLVHPKDPALAEKIDQGYAQIMHFIDTVDERDQKRPLKIQAIDALGSQAKQRADKLTVQVAQAASLLHIDVNGK